MRRDAEAIKINEAERIEIRRRADENIKSRRNDVEKNIEKKKVNSSKRS